jgi:hypothetical protein
MSTRVKRDIGLTIFGSLIVAGTLLAVALFAIQVEDDNALCDQACIAESAQEP